MIDIHAKIHDKFSVEFKVGFVVRRKLKDNNFVMNTWVFVPNSLDINPATYTKNQFYRDIKSNVRLITPIFLLRDIASGTATPLNHIKEAFNQVASDPTRTAQADYEYQIKMFTAIFKSAVRDEVLHIRASTSREDIDYLCKAFMDNLVDVTLKYRELRKIINTPTIDQKMMNYFLFGDEFMSNIVEVHTLRLISALEKKGGFSKTIDMLSGLCQTERAYKVSMGYLVAKKDDPENNRQLVFRQSVLKKYVESDLFLNARKQKDGVLVEQIYYSLAAGLSMIFATTIAFAFQQKFGNFTMPLFVALVVSYMLKDRIKELMRYYFAHRLKDKYFDNKTTISVKDIPIGWIKEGVDFISESKVLREVMEIRSRSSLLEAENRVNDEKILLYRKHVHIDREKLDENNQYTVAGVNDILRLHIHRFTQKMDNPEAPLHILDDNGKVTTINGEKIYYLNLIMQFQYEEQLSYKRYRVVMNRSGISEIQELK